MAASFTDITTEELDALIMRVTQAKEHQLALSAEDCELLLKALMTLTGMQEKLADKSITIHKLRKLAGIVKSSESLTSAVAGSSRVQKKATKKKKAKPVAQVKPQVEHHAMETLQKGDICPQCETGKLYKFEPATFLRVTGHSPYTPVQHVMERLRCNACGEYFTADVTRAVSDDGELKHKYGYSARALMAVSKYYAGSPFYRQGSMQSLLGVSISASTIFDQTEYLANDVFPVFNILCALAADARHYYMDDTTHRILSQKEVLKTSRDGKLRKRTGVYTSGLIATVTDNQHIVLFKTNIGHAGEFIDEILAKRTRNLTYPIVMSDGLVSNNPTEMPVRQSLCNSHGRRYFYDVHSHFPEEVEWVLAEYGKIWEVDHITVERGMSAQARCEYHRTHSLPVMKAIRDWGLGHFDNETVEPNSGLGKAINYFIKHFDGLTAFSQVPGAQVDNNLMENQLKLVIRDRKNAMFKRTQAGADIGDVITSLIATCVESGTNALDYLITLQRENDRVKVSPEQYLPWNYISGGPD